MDMVLVIRLFFHFNLVVFGWSLRDAHPLRHAPGRGDQGVILIFDVLRGLN